jgi:hypothetical protein
MRTTDFTHPTFGDSGIDRIMNMLDAGEVQRFHAEPSVPPQSVGRHVYGVMAIAVFIRTHISVGLLLRCLTHDAAERFSGDVPFTAKQAFTDAMRAEFKKHEYAFERNHLWTSEFDGPLGDAEVCKLADMLEGLRFAKRYGITSTVSRRWASALTEYLDWARLPTVLTRAEINRALDLFRRFAPAGHNVSIPQGLCIQDPELLF